MINVRAILTLAVISTLIIGFCVVPVIANGVTLHYVLYVDFYPYCNLSHVQVILDDQIGRVVATGYSPDGSETIITYQTLTAPNSLTLRASGQVSIGSYVWSASGISIVKIGSDTSYWIWVKMH